MDKNIVIASLATSIKQGKMTLANVPQVYQEAVAKLLEENQEVVEVQE